MPLVFGIQIGGGEKVKTPKLPGPDKTMAESILKKLALLEYERVHLGEDGKSNVKMSTVFGDLPDQHGMVYLANLIELRELVGSGDGSPDSAGASKDVTNRRMGRDFMEMAHALGSWRVMSRFLSPSGENIYIHTNSTKARDRVAKSLQEIGEQLHKSFGLRM